METASDAVTPEGLEERLRQRVLAAAPQAEKRIFRPRGYVRKAVLAAVLAVILTISAGAAVLPHAHSASTIAAARIIANTFFI